MPLNYDAESIRRHADELEAQADRSAIVAVVIAGLLGLVLGAGVFGLLYERNEVLAIVFGLGIPLVAAFTGAALGEGYSLRIRCQAQHLLLSLAIEQNLQKGLKHNT